MKNVSFLLTLLLADANIMLVNTNNLEARI